MVLSEIDFTKGTPAHEFGHMAFGTSNHWDEIDGTSLNTWVGGDKPHMAQASCLCLYSKRCHL